MSEFTSADCAFMARALRHAEKGLYSTMPNPRVGCVLVQGEQIVGEGWHEFAGGPHAEIVALRAAGERARGATAYVTLEPCCHHGRTPPCSDALIRAGVARVVTAMEDPNPRVAGQGLAQLRAAGVKVAGGLMALEAERINPGFVLRMREGRPLVRVKLAMSLDGRTAMASGESKWITGPAARDDVQRLRARSCAIVTGIGTVTADDPALTVRISGRRSQPLRVVVDSHGRTSDRAKLLTQEGPVLVVTTGRKEPNLPPSAETISLPGKGEGVDLRALTGELARREVNEVLVEAGATLAGGWLREGLVDELIVYMAPKLLSDQARGLVHIPGLETIADAIALEIDDIRAVGKDWRITAKVTTQV